MSAVCARHGALVFLALSACQSVIGIQELSEEKRPLAPGAGGSAGSGGSTDVTPGTGGTGEAPPAELSTQQPAPGNTSPPTSAPLADAGAADAAAPRPVITVQGRVIDFSRASNRKYTSADQRAVYPHDSGFDWVEQLNNIALKNWA